MLCTSFSYQLISMCNPRAGKKQNTHASTQPKILISYKLNFIKTKGNEMKTEYSKSIFHRRICKVDLKAGLKYTISMNTILSKLNIIFSKYMTSVI